MDGNKLSGVIYRHVKLGTDSSEHLLICAIHKTNKGIYVNIHFNLKIIFHSTNAFSLKFSLVCESSLGHFFTSVVRVSNSKFQVVQVPQDHDFEKQMGWDSQSVSVLRQCPH